MVIEVVQLVSKDGAYNLVSSRGVRWKQSLNSSLVVDDSSFVDKIDSPDGQKCNFDRSVVLNPYEHGTCTDKNRFYTEVPDDSLNYVKSRLFCSRLGRKPVTPSEKAVALVYSSMEDSWKEDPYTSAEKLFGDNCFLADDAVLAKSRELSSKEKYKNLWSSEFCGKYKQLSRSLDSLIKKNLIKSDFLSPADIADNDYNSFVKLYPDAMYKKDDEIEADIEDFIDDRDYTDKSEMWKRDYIRWIKNLLKIDKMESLTSSKKQVVASKNISEVINV